MFPAFLFFCRLNNDSITEEGCAALTAAFNSNHSNLIELDLSGNTLGNSGMMKICCLLKNTKRLMKLKYVFSFIFYLHLHV